MKNKIILNKKIGETPLNVLNNFKEENIFLKNEKLTYAGRLDPLAEGKMLVLIGDECKRKDKYLNLDKEYEFEILCGFKSDTGDLLGISSFNKNTKNKNDLENLNSFLGNQKMFYPVYSSKTVKGKPLFQYAKENKISKIEIPEKDIEIYKIEIIEKYDLNKKELEKIIYKKLSLVKEGGENKNDFRKEKILKNWKKAFNEIDDNRIFSVLKIKTIVSSGTYIRVLSEKIAKDLCDDYGLAFSIKRTRVGWYKKIFKFGF